MTKLGFIDILTKWPLVTKAARTTIGKLPSNKEPTSKWKKRILLAEHSPIRLLLINWRWDFIRYWVSVHFVRHKIGIDHFVRTQRTDRTGKSREDIPQDAPVDHECIANAQSMINISRKRLCSKASKETREAWLLVLKGLSVHESELHSVCVPDCIYRGYCYELDPCGYSKTAAYEERLQEYRTTK